MDILSRGNAGKSDEVPEALELLVLIVAFAEDAVFTGALLSDLTRVSILNLPLALFCNIERRRR